MALAIPLFRLRFTTARQARFTPRVGGGSAFFVRLLCAISEYSTMATWGRTTPSHHHIGQFSCMRMGE